MAKTSMRDRVREQAQKSTTEGASYIKVSGKVNFFSPKAGEYELDFLPFENDKDDHYLGYEKGDLIPFVRFKVHSGIGAEGNKYICPTTFKKPCPICNARSQMAKSSKSDPDVIKDLMPKDRMLFQLIDLQDEKKGVQLFEHSYHLFGKRLLGDIDKTENSSSTRKRSTPHAGFAELEEGQTLIVTFEEKKMGTNKFYEANRIDAEAREPFEDEILDDVLNLDDCLKVLPYDELESIFLELDPEEQGSSRKNKEDEEKGSRGSRSRSKDNDEDDKGSHGRSRRGKEEDNDDEDKSSRGRSRSRSKDDDDDEKPAERSRRSRGSEDDDDKGSTRSRRGKTETEPEPEPDKTSGRSRRSRPEPEPEPEPEKKSRRSAREPEPEPEKKSRRSRGEEKESKFSCWVEGGVFGKDCDTHVEEAPEPNCFDCPEECWEACKAAQEND